MAQFFVAHGVRAVAVHSGPGSAPRATSLEKLADGRLQVLFSIDIFNEGVDIPTIDTVLMLRPTESSVIWMQQFGRGLRKAPGKSGLKVIDDIGNHRAFLTKLRAMAAMAGHELNSDAALRSFLYNARSSEMDLPDGCSVTYELATINILGALAPSKTRSGAGKLLPRLS